MRSEYLHTWHTYIYSNLLELWVCWRRHVGSTFVPHFSSWPLLVALLTWLIRTPLYSYTRCSLFLGQLRNLLLTDLRSGTVTIYWGGFPIETIHWKESPKVTLYKGESPTVTVYYGGFLTVALYRRRSPTVSIYKGREDLQQCLGTGDKLYQWLFTWEGF